MTYFQDLPWSKRKALNQLLIRYYMRLYNTKYPDTSQCNIYFYKNFIKHAIQAEDYQSIETILLDFNWITAKLRQIKNLHDLRIDLQEYIGYLESKKVNNEKLEERCDKMKHLLDLYLRNESFLDIDKMDFVQFLLISAKPNSWIMQRALVIAEKNTKCGLGPYWKISSHQSANIPTWIESRTMVSHSGSLLPSCSSSRSEHLLLAFGCNKEDIPNQRVHVKNYESSRKVINCKIENQHTQVTDIKISSDGKFLAFSFEEIKGGKKAKPAIEWIVYNLIMEEKLRFVNSKSRKLSKTNFSNLEFSSDITNRPFLLTISNRRKEADIWKITENEIQSTNKSMSCEDEIEYCKFFGSSDNILVCQRNYDRLKFNKNEDGNWINRLLSWMKLNSRLPECRIEVWQLENWHCHRLWDVPALIQRFDDNKYRCTRYVDSSSYLYHVEYINGEIPVLLMAYSDVIGFLDIEGQNGDTIIIDMTEQFEDVFQPIYCTAKAIDDMIITDDYQYLAIHKGHNIDILEVHHLMSMPQSHHFFIVNQTKTQSLFRYDLEDKKLNWIVPQNKVIVGDRLAMKNSSNIELLDSSCCYIFDVPHVTKLYGDKKNKKLKLEIYQGKNLELISCSYLEQPYHAKWSYKCYMFDDLQLIVVIQWHACNQLDCLPNLAELHHHFAIIQLCHLKGMPDVVRKMQQILSHKGTAANTRIESARYRKSDHKLIFILTITDQDDHINQFAVIILKCVDQDEMPYCFEEPTYYEDMKILFSNIHNLVMYQRISSFKHVIQQTLDTVVQSDYSTNFFLFDRQKLQFQWYKIQDNLIKFKLFKLSSDGINIWTKESICKIVLPTDELSDDCHVLFCKWDASTFIKIFGDELAEKLEGCDDKWKECVVIEKGVDIRMIDIRRKKLLLRGFKNTLEGYNQQLLLLSGCYIWPKNYLTVVDSKSCQVLQSAQIDYLFMKGNDEQSMFICKGNYHQYSIIQTIS
ncbi:uncharacterized protein TRIADDRAFT_60918 [Trichoplax adhaerens]|uniref:APAF-1 helical domain-containing protein n=1 Tax=Trichoplax adhaerens TaxID=10228 RepID=B3S9I3_TRIAD|nr:predicted protein [Trichoplax adhaerens]EDV20702.1 predicted protein [Trichoplax adhaerens]|eukprot:XP_002116902.1 predicted protein [Trichoplax adhaerens]